MATYGEGRKSKETTFAIGSDLILSLPLKFKNLKNKKVEKIELATINQLCTLVLQETVGIACSRVVLSARNRELEVLSEFLSLLHCPEVISLLTLRLPNVPGMYVTAFVRCYGMVNGQSITSGFGNDRSEELCISISSFNLSRKQPGIVIEIHSEQHGIRHSRTLVNSSPATCSDIRTAYFVLPHITGDTTIKKFVSRLEDTYPNMFQRMQSADLLLSLRRLMSDYTQDDGGTCLEDSPEK